MANETVASSRRPFFVTLLAVLLYLQGLLRFCFGAYTLSAAIIAGIITLFGVSTHNLGLVFSTAIFWLLSGLIYFFFTAGLWLLKSWAYWAIIILASLSLLGDIIALVESQTVVWSIIISMLFSVIVLIGFFTPSVRNVFR